MKSFILFLLLVPCLIYSQDTIKTYSQLTAKPVEYEKTEFDIAVTSAFSNPYDQKEIALDMILTSPNGRQITLPCYYVSGNSALSSWKARFAAQEMGSYKYYFKLSKNSLTAAMSPSDSFSVASPTRDGFLHKNDLWTFKYDSGKLFRGIGENIGWESRSWEDTKYTYDYLLPSLSRNGANFFRTWMCPWNLAVEWKQVKDTKRYTPSSSYFNESGIKRMDELINLAESLKLHIMLAMDWHGALISGDGWTISNYNSANGGPVATPAEFFTSAAAKNKYKNRLRYLVARWGYSTSIGSFEFFNEIDNAAFNSSDNVIIPLSTVAQWHDEMSTYLKSIDPYGHLVTTSVSHRDITGMNALNNLDFNQKHIYKNTSAIPSTIKSYVSSTGKPYVIGEFGFRWEDANPAYSYDFNYDYKRGLWYGLFTSTPILPMTWWWELFDNNGMTPYFAGVREISDQMLSAGNGTFEPLYILAPGVEAYGMKCGEKYFVYLLNGTTTDSLKFNVTFAAPDNKAYEVKKFNTGGRFYTDMGTVLTASGKMSIPSQMLNSRNEFVLVFTPQILQSGKIVTFKADNTSLEVNSADSCKLSWIASPGSKVTLDGVPVNLTDSKTVSPKTTTTYVLIASGETSDTSRITVNVTTADKINRALNHEATVSGTNNGSASNAVDGDSLTFWESGSEVSPWIKVDLGKDYQINRTVIKWGKVYGRSYSIQVQSSTGQLSKIYSNTQGDGGTDDITGLSLYGRYLRLLCLSKSATDQGCIVNELEIYSSPSTSVTPKPAAAASLPKEFALEQNYPNPFNPSTRITYSLPEVSRVKIEVYNLLGKLVATLADGVQSAGNKQISFDASALNSGVYFYSINASSVDGKSSFSRVKKMTVVK